MREVEEKKWQQQYDKLVEFKRNNGNCLVPRGYREDKSLGRWVDKQRQFLVDRKELLNELGFVWRVHTSAPSSWNQQYEKLVAFKRKNSHCIVPRSYQEDVSLGMWVSNQRHFHVKNKLRLHRKKLLDEIGFAWKAYTLAARSYILPWMVRGLSNGSFHAFYSGYFSHFRSCSAFNLCVLGCGFGSVHQQYGSSKRNTRRTGARTRPRWKPMSISQHKATKGLPGRKRTNCR
jgi:hypothetical protein